MPSELAHRVDTGGVHPVLELTGALDAEVLRAAVLTALADQPEALDVDVTGLAVSAETRHGAHALAEVARLDVAWPCTRLVVCTGAGTDAWRTPGLTLAPDLAAAQALLGPAAVGVRIGQDLEPVVGAARRARELVTAACATWGLPRAAGHGAIVVTEMVNNVVAHARTAMTVLLGRHGETVSVAVRDYSGSLPRYTGKAPAPTSYGGRGLLLIDSVSVRWGHLGVPGGKIVWALLQDEPD